MAAKRAFAKAKSGNFFEEPRQPAKMFLAGETCSVSVAASMEYPDATPKGIVENGGPIAKAEYLDQRLQIINGRSARMVV
jgi:hypothetical protein